MEVALVINLMSGVRKMTVAIYNIRIFHILLYIIVDPMPLTHTGSNERSVFCAKKKG